MGAEARAGLDPVFVDDPQRAVAHVRRIEVVGERKAVIRVEPTVIGMAPFTCAAQLGYGFVLSKVGGSHGILSRSYL